MISRGGRALEDLESCGTRSSLNGPNNVKIMRMGKQRNTDTIFSNLYNFFLSSGFLPQWRTPDTLGVLLKLIAPKQEAAANVSYSWDLPSNI